MISTYAVDYQKKNPTGLNDNKINQLTSELTKKSSCEAQ